LSPLFHDFSHLGNKEINCHIFVGSGEPPVFQEQSRKFYEHLTYSSKFQKTNFEIYNNFDHFDIIEDLTKHDYKMMKLFIGDLNG
jgi:hypothetical protein